MHTPAFVTRAELAKRWRVTSHCLDGLATKGLGPPYRLIGRQALYELKDIEHYESRRLVARASVAMKGVE